MSFLREALYLLSLAIWLKNNPVLSAGLHGGGYAPCIANGRVSGVCIDIKECHVSLGYLRASVTLPTCIVRYPKDGVTYVCCQEEKRISAQKCEEYQEVLKKTTSVTPLLPLPFLPDLDDKSSEVKCDHIRNALISGGRNAEPDEMPFMVALGYNVANIPWRCGGTLISEEFVLTAAHCVVNQYAGPPTKLLLGDVSLTQSTSTTREIVGISKIIPHPSYNPPLTYNDIALIKMNKRVKISKSVRPACLPQAEDDLLKDIESKNFTASGFGITGVGEAQSETLQVVGLTGYRWKNCKTFYGHTPAASKKFPNGILRTQICAGDSTGRNDTCQGDSGGPLLLPNKEKHCVHYVTGITSFGPNQCGEGAPAVYTNVLSYLDWIEDEVWSNRDRVFLGNY